MHLAHAGQPEGRGGGALAQVALGLGGLDVHDDVGAGELGAHGLLDEVGDRVGLHEAGVGADRHHEVDEVAAGRVAHPHATGFDGHLETGDPASDRLGGLDVGLVHEHRNRRGGQAPGGAHDEHGDDERGDRVGLRFAGADEDQAGQDGQRAGEVGGEVQRVGGQRGGVIAA